jgi:hypothetical protein
MRACLTCTPVENTRGQEKQGAQVCVRECGVIGWFGQEYNIGYTMQYSLKVLAATTAPAGPGR